MEYLQILTAAAEYGDRIANELDALGFSIPEIHAVFHKMYEASLYAAMMMAEDE